MDWHYISIGTRSKRLILKNEKMIPDLLSIVICVFTTGYVNRLLRDNIVPNVPPVAAERTNEFRTQRLYFKEIDLCFKPHIPLLKILYKRYLAGGLLRTSTRLTSNLLLLHLLLLLLLLTHLLLLLLLLLLPFLL